MNTSKEYSPVLKRSRTHTRSNSAKAVKVQKPSKVPLKKAPQLHKKSSVITEGKRSKKTKQDGADPISMANRFIMSNYDRQRI